MDDLAGPEKFRWPENVPHSQESVAKSFFIGSKKPGIEILRRDVKSALIEPVGQRNSGPDGINHASGERNPGSGSLPLEAGPARHRLFQQPRQPDAVVAPLHAAVLALPQVALRDNMLAVGALDILR
jgi:hypothetical protein